MSYLDIVELCGLFLSIMGIGVAWGASLGMFRRIAFGGNF